jgi:glutathione peroxidase
MKKLSFLLFVLLPALVHADPCADLLNFKMKQLRSTEQVDFCKAYQGKIILAVNTASKCGFTPQFKGLEQLYNKYKDRGLVVLGFPSADFFQEFDDSEETAKVCYINYGVTFPMFEKSAVSGSDANAFFQKLSELSETRPKWNFYKYLISRNGLSVEAFSNFTEPKELEAKIETLINSD